MIFKIHLLFLCKVCALCLQASLATVHNLWIAGTIGVLLAGFLWWQAPLLIRGALQRLIWPLLPPLNSMQGHPAWVPVPRCGHTKPCALLSACAAGCLPEALC